MDSIYFDEVISYFPENLRYILKCISDSVKKDTYEIRLRAGKPIVLYGKYGCNFMKNDSTVSRIDCRYCVTVSDNDIRKIVSRICNYSVYTHQNDMSNGFVTFGNGHRAGFCGTAVVNNNSITALRDITSINIRIARFFENAADELIDFLSDKKNFSGIIVAGAPCTGKTTLLRSFASKVSSMYNFGFMKTVVIDERSEMIQGNGVNCDVLRGFSKTDGISHAIRVLSPEIIVCDEVISSDEAADIIKGCYTGVKFIVSVHIGTPEDIFQRSVSKTLAGCGFFDYIVFLDNCNFPGKIKKIVRTQELKNESCCNSYGFN